MHFLPLIEAKRDGQTLTPEQIQEFVNGVVTRNIPDYQMAAMLMAIYFRGLTTEETRSLTLAMRDSGDILTFPKDSRPLVDKHSTGGVGDKISLSLAPLLACLGFRVPMISGRGLGITGGTLDKLESIPGFNTALSAEEIVEQVQTVGCVICGQTDKMVPADKLLYALRDVTGTVPSIPLITASILSKKLAENLDALVLDVKFGCAAFMQTEERARELAKAMVALGKECGVNTRALLTNMDVPLGRTAGNWLEVQESVECLSGRHVPDLPELVIETAAHLLIQTGRTSDLNVARKQATDCLMSGAPLKKWEEMLAAQGADLDRYHSALKETSRGVDLKAGATAHVQRIDARIVGEIVRDLGGGRLAKDTRLNHAVGISDLVKPGEMALNGQLIARIHAATPTDAEKALARLRGAFTFSEAPPITMTLVHEVIS